MDGLRNHARKRPLRHIAAGLLTLTLAATAGFIVAGPAAHADHAPPIYVSGKTRLATSPSDVIVTVGLDTQPLDHDTLIAAEFEGTANDPESNSGAGDPASYGTPDAYCVIPAGESFCDLTLRISFPAPLGETVRIFVSAAGSSVDTWEGTESLQRGCTEDPDSTEVVRIISSGTSQEPPPPIDPPAGANPDPYTCDNPDPGASGSPSASPTDSGSPTPTGSPTGTASPSPTPTDTGTPTPTTSPTPTPTPSTTTVVTAPYDGRFRTDSCATYFPLTQNAPCTTSGAADAASGAAAATVTLAPAAGELATLAVASASSGVVHTMDRQEGTVVARVRIDRGSIRAARNAGSLGSPRGAISVVLSYESACGSDSRSHQLALDGSGEVEGQIVELSLYVGYCETATSISAGIQADASISPLSSGEVAVDAAATVLRLTVF